jgi:hypothetical protein
MEAGIASDRCKSVAKVIPATECNRSRGHAAWAVPQQRAVLKPAPSQVKLGLANGVRLRGASSETGGHNASVQYGAT